MYTNALVNKILDIKEILIVIDFLEIITAKLAFDQANRQLAIIYINKKLRTDNLIIKKYRRIFFVLAYKSFFYLNFKNILSFFIIFKKYLDNLIFSLFKSKNSYFCFKKKLIFKN